jgi:hypothetical protein
MKEFWQQIAEAAARVLSCPTCQASAAGLTSGRHPGERGLPQPGWVGPQLQPGTGVVIVLRNPAVADDTYGTAREQETQGRLRLFDPASVRITPKASLLPADDPTCGRPARQQPR